MKLILICILFGFWVVFYYLHQPEKEKFTASDRYFNSNCVGLNFDNCMKISNCGWLKNDLNYSRCLPGTPVGPLNPKFQPDAEQSIKGNIQSDMWIYSNTNSFNNNYC